VCACVCAYALWAVAERPGSLSHMFFSRHSSLPNSLSKLGGNIRTTQTNQHLRVRSTTWALYIVLVFLLLTTALVVPFTLLKHLTSHALLTSPTPRQRVFVCGACTGIAQVVVSLVAPVDSLFKQSILRCLGVCLTSCLLHIDTVVIFVTHESMMTIPTQTVWTPTWYALWVKERTHNPLDDHLNDNNRKQ